VKVSRDRKEYQKGYYQNNKEKFSEYREKNKEKNKEYQKEWRENNKEYQKEWKESNKEYHNEWRESNKEYQKKWFKKNPEKIRAQRNNRRALKMNAKGRWTSHDIEIQIRSQTNKKGKVICWWDGKPIKGVLHRDHRIALSSGGDNQPSNLCISCGPCNLSKGSKKPFEFNGRLL